MFKVKNYSLEGSKYFFNNFYSYYIIKILQSIAPSFYQILVDQSGVYWNWKLPLLESNPQCTRQLFQSIALLAIFQFLADPSGSKRLPFCWNYRGSPKQRAMGRVTAHIVGPATEARKYSVLSLPQYPSGLAFTNLGPSSLPTPAPLLLRADAMPPVKWYRALTSRTFFSLLPLSLKPAVFGAQVDALAPEPRGDAQQPDPRGGVWLRGVPRRLQGRAVEDLHLLLPRHDPGRRGGPRGAAGAAAPRLA